MQEPNVNKCSSLHTVGQGSGFYLYFIFYEYFLTVDIKETWLSFDGNALEL